MHRLTLCDRPEYERCIEDPISSKSRLTSMSILVLFRGMICSPNLNRDLYDECGPNSRVCPLISSRMLPHCILISGWPWPSLKTLFRLHLRPRTRAAGAKACTGNGTALARKFPMIGLSASRVVEGSICAWKDAASSILSI